MAEEDTRLIPWEALTSDRIGRMFYNDTRVFCDFGVWTCFGKVESCFKSGGLPLVSGGADEIQ
jgi:hypothetical protein